VIRHISSRPGSVFLTFDDGPDSANTERVLDILKAADARATFFLIANKIAGQERLVQRIHQEGHAIGNHSWDHRYRNYFKSRRSLRQWVEQANREFKRVGIAESVGFRPPAGVVTPPLKKVLRELGEPLVLWNERFYDTVRAWTAKKAVSSAERLTGGSVVLLHDRRRVADQHEFFSSLELYIDQIRLRGLNCHSLSRALCEGGFT
jgi:peptidoglycan/xylan/chitin deacetylase (PgdA/CDA1 family)